MKKDNNKKIIITLTLLVLVLSVLCILFATDTISFKSNAPKNNDSESKEKVEEPEKEESKDSDELGSKDTFTADDAGHGVVEVIGYAEVKEIADETDSANYVYFHITETKSTEFKKFLDDWKGNLFVLDNAIGLGCSIDGKITYYNSSDDLGDQSFTISEEETNKILQSTESNPVRLKLNRLIYTSGKGAPLCYSHITKVEVVN